MTGIEIATPFGKKILAILSKKFGTSVVERWTRYRAERFFDGFVMVLAAEITDEIELKEVEDMLDEILNDDAKSEVLYDAYRRVCFSKSKDLVPKIIGLLTGRLLIESRSTNSDEEKVFRASELLTDGEFAEFHSSSDDYTKRAQNESDNKSCFYKYGDLVIVWEKESRDSAWPHTMEQDIDVSAINLDIAMGYWASQPKDCGMIGQRITESHAKYEPNCESISVEGGIVTTYKKFIIFHHSCDVLSKLVCRAFGNTNIEPIKNT